MSTFPRRSSMNFISRNFSLLSRPPPEPMSWNERRMLYIRYKLLMRDVLRSRLSENGDKDRTFELYQMHMLLQNLFPNPICLRKLQDKLSECELRMNIVRLGIYYQNQAMTKLNEAADLLFSASRHANTLIPNSFTGYLALRCKSALPLMHNNHFLTTRSKSAGSITEINPEPTNAHFHDVNSNIMEVENIRTGIVSAAEALENVLYLDAYGDEDMEEMSKRQLRSNILSLSKFRLTVTIYPNGLRTFTPISVVKNIVYEATRLGYFVRHWRGKHFVLLEELKDKETLCEKDRRQAFYNMITARAMLAEQEFSTNPYPPRL